MGTIALEKNNQSHINQLWLITSAQYSVLGGRHTCSITASPFISLQNCLKGDKKTQWNTN